MLDSPARINWCRVSGGPSISKRMVEANMTVRMLVLSSGKCYTATNAIPIDTPACGNRANPIHLK